MSFIPKVRFAVMSDIHITDEHTVSRERFAKAIQDSYAIAKNNPFYTQLDAIFIVGDFVHSGTQAQFDAFKHIIDSNVDKSETKVIISVAGHEFRENGPKFAYDILDKHYNQMPDVHEVIKDFHCISISPNKSVCHNSDKIEWMKKQLEIAAAESSEKPIFVFQHPHNTRTVYGSIVWAVDSFLSLYINYPQIINFSGHSHAPINHPRSIHQKYFTSVGTGTLNYFGMDDFDKVSGTKPPRDTEAAQLLIVEADAQNRVRIYPYDIISGQFFPDTRVIDKPGDIESFLYTDERYMTDVKPYFAEDDTIRVIDKTDTELEISFPQAKIEEDRVDCYYITVKHQDAIVKKLSIWSQYYLYDMPDSLSLRIDGLKPHTSYTLEITAFGFWENQSEKSLLLEFETEETNTPKR